MSREQKIITFFFIFAFQLISSCRVYGESAEANLPWATRVFITAELNANNGLEKSLEPVPTEYIEVPIERYFGKLWMA